MVHPDPRLNSTIVHVTVIIKDFTIDQIIQKPRRASESPYLGGFIYDLNAMLVNLHGTYKLSVVSSVAARNSRSDTHLFHLITVCVGCLWLAGARVKYAIYLWQLQRGRVDYERLFADFRMYAHKMPPACLT